MLQLRKYAEVMLVGSAALLSEEAPQVALEASRGAMALQPPSAARHLLDMFNLVAPLMHFEVVRSSWLSAALHGSPS